MVVFNHHFILFFLPGTSASTAGASTTEASTTETSAG
jgi:hypothetical protein